MGWFDDAEGRVLGDEPLDDLRGCLLGVGRSYRDALGRPPTLAELAEVLRLVLNGLSDEEVAGTSHEEIIEVRFKSRRRPKKGTWEPGDVFMGKLADGTYGFCRVLFHQSTHSHTVVQLLRAWTLTPRLKRPVQSLERLDLPYTVGGIELFEQLRWTKVGSTPGYRAPDLDDLRFYSWTGRPGVWHLFDVAHKTIDREIRELPIDATDCDRFTLKQPVVFEQFVMETLDAQGVVVE